MHRLLLRVLKPSEAQPAIETAFFAGSLAAMQAGRLLYTLALASRLDSSDFTRWSLLIATLGYSPILLLGLISGLGRDLPYLVGAGRRRDARTSESTVWCITLLLALGAAALTTAVGWLTGRLLPLLVVFLLSSWLLLQIQQVVLRSHLKFTAASWQQLAFGILAVFAGGVFLVVHLKTLEEAIILHVLAALGALSLGVSAHRPALVRPTVRTTIRLAAVGLPIASAGVLFSLLMTADRWIAASLLGTRSAAPYALASTLASGLMVLPTAISQQTYPRMALAYGVTKSAAEVLRIAKGQNRTAGRATLLVAGPASALASAGILLLPNGYHGAVPVLITLSLSLLALAHSTGFGNALNTLGGQWLYLACQTGALVIGMTAMLLLGIQLGLVGIALGVGTGYVAFALLTRGAVRLLVPVLTARPQPPSGRPDPLAASESQESNEHC